MVAKAKVQIEVVGRSAVKRALQGTTRDVHKTQRDQRRETNRTEREVTESYRDMERAAGRFIAESLRDFTRAERTKRREASRTSREMGDTGAGRRPAGGGRAGAGVAGRLGGMAMGGVGSMIGAMGLAGIGTSIVSALTGSIDSAVAAIESRSGVQDIGATITSVQDFDLALTQVAQQRFTGLNDDEFAGRVNSTRERIDDVAESTGVDRGELLSGLSRAQNEFSSFDFGLESMEATARASVSLGIDMGALVSVLGQAKRQFGITGEEADEFFAVMVQQARSGSVTASQFGSAFARDMGTFTSLTGRGGIEGFREFGALAQVQMAGGGGAELAATRNRSVFASLSNGQVRRNLHRRGVEVTDDNGGVRGFADIMEDIASSDRFRTDEGEIDVVALGRVFTDRRAQSGIVTFLNQIDMARESGEMNPLRAIEAASLDEGREVINQGFGRVAALPGQVSRREAATGERARRGNLDAQVETANLVATAHSQMRAIPVIGESLATSGAVDTALGLGLPISQTLGRGILTGARSLGIDTPMLSSKDTDGPKGAKGTDGASKVVEALGQPLAVQNANGTPLRVEVVNPSGGGRLGAVVPEHSRDSNRTQGG